MPIDYGYFEEKELGKAYDSRLLKRLVPYARPYKLLLLLSLILVLAITVFDLSLPYLTKTAIDNYIVPGIRNSRSAEHQDSQGEKRYLQVDLSQPKNRQIVEKYQDLFRKKGDTARISYQDLERLAEGDLAELRDKDLRGVALIAGLYLIIILFNFLCNVLQRIIMEYVGQRIMHDLRCGLYSHIQSLTLAFFNQNPVGRLVTRVTNDVQNMHNFFKSVIIFAFKDLFLLLGIAVMLLTISWQLALVSFIVLPFVLLAARVFANKARTAFRSIRIKLAEINTRFSETIDGIRIIQIFRRERSNYDSFRRLNHEYYQAGMRQIQVMAIFLPVVEVFSFFSVAVIVYYGGGQVISGTVSLGALVAFISYLRMFFRPIRDIAEKYNVMQNAMASAERIFQILDDEDKDASQGHKLLQGPIQSIDLQDVSFSYIPGEKVLKNITFSVQAGENLAIVGPTGSGKTSLINLLTRFYQPDSGRIQINKQDIRELDLQEIRSRMALVMQDPFLFSLTIRQNILQGNAYLSEEKLLEILEAAKCKDLVNKLPQGLDTVLSEGGSSLSTGEQQLISIARAMTREPELIILDEATSSVDSQTEKKVQEALQELMKGRTSLTIAHRLSTARNADRILVLHKGHLVEEGNHEELMRKKGLYYKLNQLQI